MIVNSSKYRKIKTNDKLCTQLMDMAKRTALGQLEWEVICSTSEYNEDKAFKRIDGKQCLVDECFVSYYTKSLGDEFLMISYENIISCGNDKRTTSLIYLPPLGIRYFDVNALAPYAVESDQMLIYAVHELWKVILEQRKTNPNGKISLIVEAREVS